MLKVSVTDLESALKLIKSTSLDMHATVRIEPELLVLSFGNRDNQLTSITLFAEHTKCIAKATTTENLSQILQRSIK